MDSSQFIRVKSLEGELLFSQKRKQLGFTITTKELIIQQPHTTYHMLLKDIIGLVPFQLNHLRRHIGTVGEIELMTDFQKDYYKMTVRNLHIINRQGVHERSNTDLIVPLNDRFIQKFAEYSDFSTLPV